MTELAPGSQVAEHLRLVRLLGRGAMGSVWLADHLSLQAQVAVKFMSPAMAEDETSVQRFRLEARAAAEIRSPHVVQVFDHGVTEDERLYIVMELLDGESLSRRVQRRPLSPVELADVIKQVCKGLAKAHACGIIHRDIKPSNVFLLDADGDTFVKLLDFGVAKFAGEQTLQMTTAGNMVGTPAFMGPEQLFEGESLDHRCDLWALAVVAYYALTGTQPFTGRSMGELCVAVHRRKYKPVTSLRPELPAELDGFFEQAFHEDIGQRFGSARQLAQALAQAVGVDMMRSAPDVEAPISLPVGSVPGTNLPSLPSLPVMSLAKPPSRRAPLAAAAVVGAVLLVGAVVLVSTMRAETPAPAVAATTESRAEAAPAVAEPPGRDATGADASSGPADTAAPEGETSGEPAASGTPVSSAEPSASGTPSGQVATPAAGSPRTGPGTSPRTGPGPKTPDARAHRAAEELGI